MRCVGEFVVRFVLLGLCLADILLICYARLGERLVRYTGCGGYFGSIRVSTRGAETSMLKGSMGAFGDSGWVFVLVIVVIAGFWPGLGIVLVRCVDVEGIDANMCCVSNLFR